MRVLSVVMIAILAFGVMANAQSTTELNEEILGTAGSQITFYGHQFAFGPSNPMPMNTQFPSGESDYSRGQPIAGCGTPGNPTCADWVNNEMFWYTTAGFVQVKDDASWAGDYSKFHNERGQTKDIYLDTAQPMDSEFYMSADAHAWYCEIPGGVENAFCWNWDAGAFVDWRVESWVWYANLGEWGNNPEDKPDVTAVRTRQPEATLIAHGVSDTVDLISVDSNLPGGFQTVYPFPIEYEWDADFVSAGGVVPYRDDLIVEFEWYQETDGMGKYIIGGESWNLNTGEDWAAHINMPVRNPLDVELVYPRFVHDRLVILSVLNTPWGSYDIDLDSIDIEIKDAAGQAVVPSTNNFQEFVDVSVAHSGHYDPINLTWIWNYQDDKLPAGEYTIDISAANFQGSYTTSTQASFTIKQDGTGGEAVAGQSGILTFSNDQFESYKDGAGVNEGDSDSGGTPADSGGSESKGSPVGVPIVALLAGLAIAARRFR